MDTGRIEKDLDRTKRMKSDAADHHPLFRDLYFVGVAEDRRVYLFKETDRGFEYDREVDARQSIPVGIRAAFPIDSVDDCCCVVTPECLDDSYGHIALLHEMVHCFQFRTCEIRIRERLSVQRSAKERRDHMWELNHPFPYHDDQYGRFVDAIGEAGTEAAFAMLRSLKTNLSTVDYEYMIWQMWKEGFARYLENRIRRGLGLRETSAGKSTEDRDRVSLYYAGDYLWRLIEQQDDQLILDIESAFQRFDSACSTRDHH